MKSKNPESAVNARIIEGPSNIIYGPIDPGFGVPQITGPAWYLTNVSDRGPNPKDSGTAPHSGTTRHVTDVQLEYRRSIS